MIFFSFPLILKILTLTATLTHCYTVYDETIET